MGPDPLYSFVQKGLGSFRISPSGEAKANQLAVCINRTPQVAPFATNAAQVFLGAFGQLGPELDHPTLHSRPIKINPTFGEQIDHVLIG